MQFLVHLLFIELMGALTMKQMCGLYDACWAISVWTQLSRDIIFLKLLPYSGKISRVLVWPIKTEMKIINNTKTWVYIITCN